jgi:hypothetical protein
MKVANPIKLRHLVPAALLAATAALGGAVVDPALACSAPTNEFNEAGYQVCADAADEAFGTGKLTSKQYTDLLAWCCESHGGSDKTGPCIAAVVQPNPGAVEQPTDRATVPPPPPPRLPVAPQPTARATVSPQPAAPPTTSTPFPPLQ